MRRLAGVLLVLCCASPAFAARVSGTASDRFSSDGSVPTGGFLPYNPTTSTVTPSGCQVGIAGGNMGTGATGSNFSMSCDQQDFSGQFLRIMQNDNPNQPRTTFEVRRDGFTRMNGLYVVPPDSGFPLWQPKTPYGGAGGQTPTSAMQVIAGDLIDVNGSVLQVYGTLRNYYSTSSVPALMTLFGQANSNGLGGGLLGAKRFEVTDSGASTHSGIPAPSLSCATSGALAANTWYIRITLNMAGGESLMSPPFNFINCSANQVPVVTAPPVGTGLTWNVYASTGANGGHGTERLQTTGTGLTLGVNWQMPNTGLAGSTQAPMYVTNALQTLTGSYPCPSTPSLCATLNIGGETTGGTANYALNVGAGKTRFAGDVVVATPGSPASNAACEAGKIIWDTGFIYVCTASGVWKRAALTGGY